MREMSEAIARQAPVIPNVQNGVSVKQLFQLFPPSSPNSVNALRVAMGPFKPQTDAFRFGNSFPITAENAAQFQQHYQTFSDAVIGGLVEIVTGSVNGYSFGPVSIPGTIADIVIGKVTDFLTGGLASKLVDAIVGQVGAGGFGRCGGMAFAGNDFYLANWPVDERLGTTPPATGPLSDYIFQRLLDSLDANGLTFLTWLMNYYVMPDAGPIATAALLAAAEAAVAAAAGPVSSVPVVGPVVGVAAGGAEAVAAVAIVAGLVGKNDIFNWGGPLGGLNDTKTQWTQIKAKLNTGAAWPIGVIFSDTPNPIEQHQILAIGYSDRGDGTATLDVWDNNERNLARTLGLNFQGNQLQVTNFLNDRPAVGIFLEGYSPVLPPASLHLPLEASEQA